MAQRRKHWYVHALLVSVTGLIFSFFVSGLILVLNLTHFAPVADIGRVGVDASMKLFVKFPWLTDPPEHRYSQKYVFIDVDELSCKRFVAADICAGQEMVPVELVESFLSEAKKASAKLIIIDTLPNDPVRRQAFYEVLRRAGKDPTGPWIIAPYISFPHFGENGLEELTDLSLLEIESGSRLRLAGTSVTNDPGTYDNVIRSYPVMTSVGPLGDGTDVRDRWIPSVPALAAMLSSTDTANATDCYFYRQQQSCSNAHTAPQKLKTLIQIGERDNLGNKIFYTFPSLSLGDTERPSAGIYLGRYDRYPAITLLDGTSKVFSIPSDLLNDRIVILGSSELQADDLHMTPIGPMSGAEIIINATRSIHDFSFIQSSSKDGEPGKYWLEFEKRLGAALWGFPIFLSVWMIIFWLQDHDLGIDLRGKALGLLRSALIVIVFASGFALTLLLDLAKEVAQMREEVMEGVATDILTPVIALGLEGFAEGARVISRFVETRLECLFDRTVRITNLLRSALKRSEEEL